jgi:hypothetical protein
MRTVLISIGLFGLLCAASAQPQSEPGAGVAAEKARLRAESRRLEQIYGPNHPELIAVKDRLTELDDVPFKKSLLVLTRTANVSATLRDVRVQALGGRQFLVGTEIASEYHKGTFAGKQVWLPIDDVAQMVEISEPKSEKK